MLRRDRMRDNYLTRLVASLVAVSEGDLAVEPQQVVLGEGEALMGGLDFRLPCGRCQLYRCSQIGSSAARRAECRIGLGVGPFAERGLDEALGLAVGLWACRAWCGCA